MSESDSVDGQTMFTLTIPLGGSGHDPVTLSADVGIGINPTIGISRDERGRFHFHVGGNDFLSDDLPSDVRRFYEELNHRSRSLSGRLHMPPCRILGQYTWSDYDRDRVLWHSRLDPINGEVWPYLPPRVFGALVRACALRR